MTDVFMARNIVRSSFSYSFSERLSSRCQRSLSAHGFRSTFVEWAKANRWDAELRGRARSPSWSATQPGRAYDREDELEERGRLMPDGAGFCTGNPQT
jgi:hypothetical protein